MENRLKAKIRSKNWFESTIVKNAQKIIKLYVNIYKIINKSSKSFLELDNNIISLASGLLYTDAIMY